MDKMISYSHFDSPEIRFAQFEKDPIPSWAVDIKEHIPQPDEVDMTKLFDPEDKTLTKKQLAEQERVEREAAREAEFKSTLPLTLLTLIARYRAVGVDQSVMFVDGELTVEFVDKYGDREYVTMSSTEQQIRNVEFDIEDRESLAEAVRKQDQLKQSALSKLTDEEREALGL